jgi:hypothetical protein
MMMYCDVMRCVNWKYHDYGVLCFVVIMDVFM